MGRLVAAHTRIQVLVAKRKTKRRKNKSLMRTPPVPRYYDGKGGMVLTGQSSADATTTNTSLASNVLSEKRLRTTIQS